jgi:bifunctional DNase/RNase
VTAGADEIIVTVIGVFEEALTIGAEERRIPVMLLRDAAEREVRVPIASCEGLAIQIALEQHVVPRPLTHDLALRLLERLSARLDRVVVDSVSVDRPHAILHLHAPEGEVEMDARPGDAIALALRADVPIHVKDQILAKSSYGPL